MFIPDRELLRRYVQEGSEDAFTEIVHRHVNLVFGSARRQLGGDASLAQDVAQSVFMTLAVKAKSLPNTAHLSAWLYTAVRFTVSHTVRAEHRRQIREQKAQILHSLSEESDSHPIPEIPSRFFDAVLERLNEGEREAILLRFFEGQSFAAIGLTMQLSEDAARMRVGRALEKARKLFAKRGIKSSSAALGAALTSQAVAAPAGLASIISTSVLTGTASIAATAGVGFAIFSFMATSKGILLLASAAVISALGYATFEHRVATTQSDNAAALASKLSEAEQHIRALNDNNVKLLQGIKEIAPHPSKLSSQRAAKENYDARRKHALDLINSGDYAGGLKELLWCYNEGSLSMPGYYMTRNSVILPHLANLAGKYAPAMAALRNMQKAANDAIDTDPHDQEAIGDFVAFNRALNESDATLSRYDHLPSDCSGP